MAELDWKVFHKNLKFLRKHKKENGQVKYRTAKSFAVALGVPLATYTSYERGTRLPKTPVLLDIASLLGVPLDLLFDKECRHLTDLLGTGSSLPAGEDPAQAVPVRTAPAGTPCENFLIKSRRYGKLLLSIYGKSEQG